MNILAIDPGSTSTKIGVHAAGATAKACIEHPRTEIEQFPAVMDQLGYRLECIDRLLSERHQGIHFNAVVGRGGLMRPVAGGVYLVNDLLEADLRIGVSGEHAANLGGVLAVILSRRYGSPAYVVDPPVTDELWPVARLSGLAGIDRSSIFHALNQKASARAVAREMGKEYDAVNFVVVHMGSGITVGAHRKGMVVDVNNGLNGDGPFSPERSGGLPVAGVLQLLEQGGYSTQDVRKLVARRGGVYSYLGTVDIREVEKRIGEGDEKARLVLDAMVYQVGKEIGALAAALDGEVDGIVLTGGLAFSTAIVQALRSKVSFLAPVFVQPGENEIDALVSAALRVLTGAEEAKVYPESDHENRR